MTIDNAIKFYRTNEEYGFLSNFAPYRIFVDSTMWPTSEHYFQASKFPDYEIKMKLRAIDSPMNVANEGRKRKYPIRTDWDLVKDDVMRKTLRAKFLQHHEIKVKLLTTGDRLLVEHTENDNYWADGGDGSGKNKLGILLMELRSEIRKIGTEVEWILPPWIAFPEVDAADMFWRMGLGEDYIHFRWANWFNTLDKSLQLKYQQQFTPTEGWEDFYD